MPNAQTIADGFRSYYNFVRPHQALDGKTPTEAAKINLKLGNNKWMSLLERAVTGTTRQRIT
ncbi:MAG: transposase [Euryarchaeota archaeon]|nr:transposase [Euryarchaeota archaeon]